MQRLERFLRQALVLLIEEHEFFVEVKILSIKMNSEFFKMSSKS